MSWEVRQGDAVERLREMPDGSVQTCITSPPYYGLRDYGTGEWEGGDAGCGHQNSNARPDHSMEVLTGTRGEQPGSAAYATPMRDVCGKCGARRADSQIGLESTPDEYVARLVEVFREVKRVLRDDGTVFLNLGDSYASAGGERTYGSSDGGTGRGPGTRRFRADGGREDACGTFDTAPEGSPGRGCFCGSLCGACRVAYRTGRAHSDGLPAPTPTPSPSESSPGHTGSESVRLPTSDSTRPADHSEGATRDQQLAPAPAGARHHASSASTPGESSPPQRDQRHPSDTPSACQLCGRSLNADAQASAHTSVCTCGTSATQPSSADHSSGTEPSGGAYRHLTITSRPKPKDLLGIPWMVAFALRADGWYLRSDIIWSKPNPMPESVTDRPTKAHEYLFLLSKSPRYFYDADAIREEHQGIERPSWDGVPPPDGTGSAERNATGMVSHMHRAGNNPAGRNKRSVWTIATQPFPGAHFAVFPPKLVEPCVLAGSSETACGVCGAPWERVMEGASSQAQQNWTGAGRENGCVAGGGHFGRTGQWSRESRTVGWQPTCSHQDDTGSSVVLDPFCGAGTAGLVALRHGRSFIGIELNEEYAEMARQRIRDDAPLMNYLSEVA